MTTHTPPKTSHEPGFYTSYRYRPASKPQRWLLYGLHVTALFLLSRIVYPDVITDVFNIAFQNLHIVVFLGGVVGLAQLFGNLDRRLRRYKTLVLVAPDETDSITQEHV